MDTIPSSASRTIYITLLLTGIAFVVARTVLRWKKLHTAQVEDYLVWLAAAFYIAFLSLYIAVFPIYEKVVLVGMKVIDPYPTILQDSYYMLACIFASQLLFWSTLWTIKLSLLFWFRRLTKGLPKYTLIWRFIAGFTLLSFVACVATQFTSCRSISAWLTPGQCETPRDAMASTISIYFVLAMDLLTDILIMVIPIKLLWNLRISMGEKISIGVVFSAGFLTMVFAVLRVVMYKMPEFPDMTILALFSAIEAFIAIVVGCLPSFAVFLQSRRLNTSNANKVSSKITVNTRITVASSRAKNKARTESILLDDVAESTRQLDKHKASFDGSSGSIPQRHDDEEHFQTRRYGV